MTFDPTEFLRVANMLAEHSDEASLRTAVGRAYYSVFLQTRERLGIRGQRRHIHGQVIAALKRVDRKVGDQLDRLAKLRGAADYELDVQSLFHQDWRYNWRSASSYATVILNRLKRL